MTNTSDGARKAQAAARERLGEDKYRDIRRKAGSAKTPGYFGYLKKNDPEKLKQIVADRVARAKLRKESENKSE